MRGGMRVLLGALRVKRRVAPRWLIAIGRVGLSASSVMLRLGHAVMREFALRLAEAKTRPSSFHGCIQGVPETHAARFVEFKCD